MPAAPEPRRRCAIEISVTIGSSDIDGINVTIGDETSYCPEVTSDLCRRAGDEALRMHAALHPAHADGE